jgi:phage tail tape-measure protein
MTGYGVGASLASVGSSRQQEATRLLGEVAHEEESRNRQNKVLEMQEDASKKQLGSTIGGLAGFYAGAEAGSIGGPWGALIGGVVGYVAGGLL